MMPFHSYTVTCGSLNRSFLVFARMPDGAPASGIDLGQVRAGFVRDTEQGAHSLAGRGVLVEVDRSLVAGVYRLVLPDSALVSGANRVLVVISHPEAIFDPVEISLVAFDPMDEVRLGMTALGPKERIAALRGAFPRLSALELKERDGMGESG